MATISAGKLRQDIAALLKGADLSELSSKKIRKQLENDYGRDLTERKKEIDSLVMALIEEKDEDKDSDDNADVSQNGQDSSDSESDFEAPEDVGPPRKKAKSKSALTAPGSLEMTCEDGDDHNDEEIAKQLQAEENTRVGRTRAGASGRKTATPKAKSKPSNAKKTEGSGKKKPNLFTKQCVLSPQLAEVMGEEKMARSDVVKRMWEIIRERNLVDQKNKQFMLCDPQLLKVFGRKRVRCFGMMKYLKDHIFSEGEYDSMVLKK